MNKNKKILLYSVILLIAFYVLVEIVLSVSDGKKYKKTIFIGNTTKVHVSNEDISIDNSNVKLSRQNVKIYFKKNIIDGYIDSEKVDFDDITYNYNIYDKKSNILSPETTLIAYTDDMDVKIKNVETRDSEDLGELYAFAKSNMVTLPSAIGLEYVRISSFDYNDDNKDEYIYSITFSENDFSYEENDNYEDKQNWHSIIFLKMDDKYILLDQKEDSVNIMERTNLKFVALIDLNNDGNYEFIVSKKNGEYGPVTYELYNFDGTKFVKIGGE